MAPVRIGFNPDFSPFAELKDGAARGIAIDRARHALEAAGLDPDFVPVPLPRMFDRLMAGELDVLAGVAAAAERRGQLDYSKPLVLTGGAWFALRETAWPSDEALASPDPGGLTVTSPSAGPLVARIRARFPDLDLLPCEDYAGALRAVIDGAADAAALNLQVGRAMAEREYPERFRLPTAPFFTVPLVVAVRRTAGNDLLAALDPHIPDDWNSAS